MAGVGVGRRPGSAAVGAVGLGGLRGRLGLGGMAKAGGWLRLGRLVKGWTGWEGATWNPSGGQAAYETHAHLG